MNKEDLIQFIRAYLGVIVITLVMIIGGREWLLY